MRRRFDLAASLIAEPPILFLDEPTTGLDPESRNTSWKVIRSLVRGGTTILFTTQYLEEADQLADTVTLIDHGRIIASDTPANLKNQLGGERLDIKLTDAADLARIPLLRMKALPTEIQKGALSFAISEGDGGLKEVASILEQLIAAGVAVQDYAMQRPTLEEAFLQPVFLMILFRYVFGGAVTTGQASYADFLVPGILVVGAIHTSGVVVVSIANDMNSGMMDRFRTLPMMKSAILGGTVLSVAIRCLASVVAMLLVGLLVGFQPHADFGAWLAAMGLLLLVAYTFSWLLAVFGVMAKSVEGAQQVAGFVWPLFLLSSTFVPAQSLPGVLQGFANNQPLTHAMDAIRGLLLDQPIGNHAWLTVGWYLGIILVAVPLTGMLFRRKFS